jgi:hypothetical protein
LRFLHTSAALALVLGCTTARFRPASPLDDAVKRSSEDRIGGRVFLRRICTSRLQSGSGVNPPTASPMARNLLAKPNRRLVGEHDECRKGRSKIMQISWDSLYMFLCSVIWGLMLSLRLRFADRLLAHLSRLLPVTDFQGVNSTACSFPPGPAAATSCISISSPAIWPPNNHHVAVLSVVISPQATTPLLSLMARLGEASVGQSALQADGDGFSASSLLFNNSYFPQIRARFLIDEPD